MASPAPSPASADSGSYDGSSVAVAAAGILDAETFAHVSEYDALGRPFATTTPDGTIQRPQYNEGGQQCRLLANVRGAAMATVIVGHTEYDAHGRRTYISKSDANVAGGAVMVTTYAYDPRSFRLTKVLTTRSSDGKVMQDLRYTFDAVGNILEIRDYAHADVYFAGAVVSPTQRFVYDALYRLTAATGREHASTAEVDDVQFTPHINPSNGAQLRNYSSGYSYDIWGNLLQLAHTVIGDPAAGWHRDYSYASSSNPLQSTTVPGQPNVSVNYPHDVHGNMTAMPHLAAMDWDHADQLRHVDKLGGGEAWFQYDAAGERVRKVWEHGQYRDERLYLGGVELWRRRNLADGALIEERETVHLSDSAGRVAMVESKTADGGAAVGSPLARYRYQLDNHLGTVAVEVDEGGNVISYEEFHPYGTSAYRAEGAAIGVSRRRYRYSGKERDEETGLYYHGARYYAAWLGRWTAADPAGLVDGANLFAYVRGNPVALMDPDGREGSDAALQGFMSRTRGWWRSDQAGETPPSMKPLVGARVALSLESKQMVERASAPLPGVGVDNELPAKSAMDGKAIDSYRIGDRLPQLGGHNAVQLRDTLFRIDYLKSIKSNADGAVEQIARARLGGNAKQAEEIARKAVAFRNAARKTAQGKLSTGGRTVSDALDQGWNWETLFKKYKTDDAFETFERVTAASGRSNKLMSLVAKAGKYAGPLGVAIGAGIAVDAVKDAPEGKRTRTGFEEVGGFGGGALGGSLGTAAGATAVTAGAALLGVSGPPGWVVLVVSLAGGAFGGYYGSEAGRSVGGNLFDALSSVPNQVVGAPDGTNIDIDTGRMALSPGPKW